MWSVRKKHRVDEISSTVNEDYDVGVDGVYGKVDNCRR